MKHYGRQFFFAYFFYYSGYAVFSSFLVMYLTEKGLDATICGIVASLTLVVNLAMEPVMGYVTDTWLSIRQFLLLCIGVLTALFLLADRFSGQISLLLPLIVVTAGISYPFSQLLDAWTEISMEWDPALVYSRIRAGGSIGFAVTSIVAGYLFRSYGFRFYFLLQILLFLLLFPLLLRLPGIPPANRIRSSEGGEEQRISFFGALCLLIRKKEYVFWMITCILYWLTHRPVGSFLSLIVTARGGSASTYGNICGVGAAVEFCFLLVLGKGKDLLSRKTMALRLMQGAVLVNLLRPVCLLLLPGLFFLYLGQILQSVGFALYLSGSVECFALAAEEKLRGFSISVGLAVSSVTGTVAANLLGGRLCDLLSVQALPVLSLLAAVINLLFMIFLRKMFRKDVDI